jgi:hypothetical protein
VQEVTLASEAILIWGVNEIKWKTFAAAIDLLVTTANVTGSTMPDAFEFRRALTIIHKRAEFQL